MQLREYGTIVVRRWWLFLLIAAVAAGSAYLYSKLQRPIYKSSVFITVEPSRPDYGLTLTSGGQLRQFARRMQSEEFAREVDQRLHLDLSSEQLKAMTRTSAVPEDLVVQLDVYDPDPGRAQRIARTWGEVYIEDQENKNQRLPDTVPDRIFFRMLEQPKPGELDSPKTRVNVIAGTVLGLVVAAVIAFLLEYFDNTLKTPEDLGRHLGLNLLGSIPRIAETDARPGGLNAALRGPVIRPEVARSAQAAAEEERRR